MAITQVTTVTIDGVTIGLSDTIGALITNGDFTVENLTPYMIVGQVNKLCPKYGSFTGAERSYSGSAGSLPPQFPNVNTGSAGGVTVEFAQDDNLSLSHDMYGRNILIYGSLGTPQIYSITDGMTSSTLRVVTSIDFKKIYYDVDMSGESISFTRPKAKTITNYQSGSDGKIRTTDNDVDTNISVFAVVDDGNNESWYCLIDDLFPQSNSYAVRWLQSTPQYMSGAYQSTYATLNDGWNNFTVDKTLWRWSEPAGYLVYGGDGGNWGESFVGYIDNGNNFYAYLNYTPYGGFMQCVADGLEYALNQLANAGLKFKYNNTFYKPIAEGGIVTGYTDDMSEESDWDDIVDVTGNVVPVTPTPGPGPGPKPDNPFDVDAEIYGWGGNVVGGMVRYYLLTQTEMDNLVSAMGSSANWVIDYLNNIVSCFIVPNNGIFFSAPVPTTVKFRVDNNNKWDTGVSCKRISGVVNKSGGTIEIPRCTNSFLDFEPYSDYSVYIPFCGRIPIKGNIVCGREISVTYYPDVPTCSLTAVVTCGGSTVAIAKGQFGSMIPVTSSGADRKTAAAISDVSSIITGLGMGIAGAATGNAGFLIGGGAQLVGGLLNTAKDSVQSYAYSSGSSGDTSFFAAGTRCQYYANYLQLDDVVNTSEFGHTIGYLCKEIGKLSSYHGFTICANPHVHISATSTEKEEIKQLLEQGVILP